MNGSDGKPTTPDDDFERLVPALEEWFEKEWSELPAEFQERITRDRRAAMLAYNWDWTTPGWRRSAAQQRDWGDDPANKDEAEFWFEVPFRKPKLEAMKVRAQNVDAPDAIALAMRNAMLFYIDEAIDALPKDEEEVRSALPAKLKATIGWVRRRWTELDKRAAVLGSEGLSWVLADVGGQPAGAVDGEDPEAAETPEENMTVWLTKLMRDQPNDRITKADAHELAVTEGELSRIPNRAFDRAWSDAVKASGAKKWGRGGRRKDRQTQPDHRRPSV